MPLDPVGPECLAETMHVDLQRAKCRLRRLVAPDCIDKPVARDGRACVQEQLSQERSLHRAAKRQRASLGHGLDRPEDPKLGRDRSPLTPRQVDLKRRRGF